MTSLHTLDSGDGDSVKKDSDEIRPILLELLKCLFREPEE